MHKNCRPTYLFNDLVVSLSALTIVKVCAFISVAQFTVPIKSVLNLSKRFNVTPKKPHLPPKNARMHVSYNKVKEMVNIFVI